MRFRLETKAQRMEARSSFLPKNIAVSKITLRDDAAVVYIFSVAGKPYAKGFRGTAAKPEFYHSFKTDAQRAQYVKGWCESVRESQARKTAHRAEQAAWVNPLKVGDILHTSWGYDQTNVEFYAVTRVSGRRVWVREIAADYEGTGFMSGNTWPAMPIRFVGDETMHTAQPSGSKGVYVKISTCIHAWPVEARSYSTSSYA